MKDEGQREIQITEGRIVEPAREELRQTGAEVEFRGIVRGTEGGREIAGLEYEAHGEMARRQLERIVVQLQKSWRCQKVWVIHRVGWVPVGETSLYVRVHAPHREEAFRFCMELIDLLKKDVPIWKARGGGGSGADERA